MFVKPISNVDKKENISLTFEKTFSSFDHLGAITETSECFSIVKTYCITSVNVRRGCKNSSSAIIVFEKYFSLKWKNTNWLHQVRRLSELDSGRCSKRFPSYRASAIGSVYPVVRNGPFSTRIPRVPGNIGKKLSSTTAPRRARHLDLGTKIVDVFRISFDWTSIWEKFSRKPVPFVVQRRFAPNLQTTVVRRTGERFFFSNFLHVNDWRVTIEKL